MYADLVICSPSRQGIIASYSRIYLVINCNNSHKPSNLFCYQSMDPTIACIPKKSHATCVLNKDSDYR